MAEIDAFFDLMDKEGASDLHLAAGSQPILRVRGEFHEFAPNSADSRRIPRRRHEFHEFAANSANLPRIARVRPEFHEFMPNSARRANHAKSPL